MREEALECVDPHNHSHQVLAGTSLLHEVLEEVGMRCLEERGMRCCQRAALTPIPSRHTLSILSNRNTHVCVCAAGAEDQRGV